MPVRTARRSESRGGAAGERSERTLDADEHGGSILRRWRRRRASNTVEPGATLGHAKRQTWGRSRFNFVSRSHRAPRKVCESLPLSQGLRRARGAVRGDILVTSSRGPHVILDLAVPPFTMSAMRSQRCSRVCTCKAHGRGATRSTSVR